jgi:hypothetical protein
VALDDKITNIIITLNKLTSLDKITWEVSTPPATISSGTNSVIPLFISCAYKNRTFALYQLRYKTTRYDTDELYWTEDVVFAIMDSEERVLWEQTQYSPALNDLFETVRRKVSKIDSVLDDLLSDDENPAPGL